MNPRYRYFPFSLNSSCQDLWDYSVGYSFPFQPDLKDHLSISQKYKTLVSYHGNTWWANEYIRKRDCSNEKYTQKFSSCMTIDGKAIRMSMSNLLDIHSVYWIVSVCECSMYIYLFLRLSPVMYVCVCLCERERVWNLYLLTLIKW